MVTLSTAYGLGSLTDHTGFAHVHDDEPGCALVTLGKNLAIRYRLVDQKQLNSWSTIPPFTSKVVYNAQTSEYLAIFSETLVKKWHAEDTNLEKVAKIKLKDAGYSILLDNEPFVLFKSGACCSLTYLADKAHTHVKGFLTDGARIEAAKTFILDGKKFLNIIANIGDRKYISHCVRLVGEHSLPDLTSLTSMKLRRRGHHLVSFCFTTRDDGEFLVTLWSDSFIYYQPLPCTDEASLGQFSGVVRAVSCAAPSAMTSLSAHHVAIYGGDPAEEGAVLIVHNLDFGMVQASTKFKMMHKPPRVWSAHDRLLVGYGQRLLCVPFTLETGSVSALVGSRPLATTASVSDIMAVVPSMAWEKCEREEEHRGPGENDVTKAMDVLVSQGLSEYGICESLITEYIEKEDTVKLCWCLDHFVDIPERLTVCLLHFAFTSCESKFTRSSPISPDKTRTPNGIKTPKKKRKSVNEPHMNGFSNKLPENPSHTTETCSQLPDPTATEPSPLLPIERAEFVDRILQVPNNKVALVSALRAGFSTSDCINILKYLNYLLATGKREKNTIEWVTTVIDAFYQQLLLGKNADCVEAVIRLKENVGKQVAVLCELKSLLPNVVRLRRKKTSSRNALQLKSYSIQKIQIYQ